MVLMYLIMFMFFSMGLLLFFIRIGMICCLIRDVMVVLLLFSIICFLSCIFFNVVIMWMWKYSEQCLNISSFMLVKYLVQYQFLVGYVNWGVMGVGIEQGELDGIVWGVLFDLFEKICLIFLVIDLVEGILFYINWDIL